MSGIPRVARATVLLLGALLLALDAAQLLRAPVVGVTDNGDFWRVMRPAGIRYVGKSWKEHSFVQPEFATAKAQLGRHLSSPALVAWTARGIHLGTARPGVMDLRQVGAANWLLLVGAVALLLRTPLTFQASGLLLLWALNDPGYLLYFNTFFADAAAFIGAFGVAAWLMGADTRAESPIFRGLSAAAALLFSSLAAFAKESYAPMGLIAAVAIGAAVVRSRFRKDRALWVLVLGTTIVGVVAPIYFVWGDGYRSVRDNRHNAVFMGIAVASDDPGATFAALGVTTRIAKRSLFEVNKEDAEAALHVSPAQVALRYLEDPHAMLVASGLVADVIAWPHTNTGRNYAAAQEDGPRWVTSAVWQFGSLRRLLIRRPWQVWAWVSVCCGWVVASIAWRRVDALTGVVAYMLGLFATQIVVAVIGDGLRTLQRHLLMARLALDWCVLIVLFALVRWAVESVRQRMNRIHEGGGAPAGEC